jgi:hypothetical protein
VDESRGEGGACEAAILVAARDVFRENEPVGLEAPARGAGPAALTRAVALSRDATLVAAIRARGNRVEAKHGHYFGHCATTPQVPVPVGQGT